MLPGCEALRATDALQFTNGSSVTMETALFPSPCSPWQPAHLPCHQDCAAAMQGLVMAGFGQPAQMGNGPAFPAMEISLPPGMSERHRSEFQVSRPSDLTSMSTSRRPTRFSWIYCWAVLWCGTASVYSSLTPIGYR